MKIIAVGCAGYRYFDSFEELAKYKHLGQFTHVLVGDDIDVLPVDTDFQAYARSREQERLNDMYDENGSVRRSFRLIH